MKNRLAVVFSTCTLIAFGQSEVTVHSAMELLKEFDKVRDFTMDASSSEAYFTIQSQTEDVSVISTSSKTGGAWTTPTIASFSGAYKDMEPFLSPDGLRLYFVSNRPLHDSISKTKDYDIWYVKRLSKSSAWSKPINMGAPINSEHNEFYPAMAQNGNFYYTGDRPESKGEDDIFFSEFKNGTYSEPISLDENINSEGYEYNAYISKDDTYLIFGGYNREDGQGSGDLYISFKNGLGEWSKAKPLPQPINSKQMDYCPFVDEKNNTLYFTSRRISNPQNPISNMQSLVQFLNSYENGNSRLYKANINLMQFQP